LGIHLKVEVGIQLNPTSQFLMCEVCTNVYVWSVMGLTLVCHFEFLQPFVIIHILLLHLLLQYVKSDCIYLKWILQKTQTVANFVPLWILFFGDFSKLYKITICKFF
jgi:hypothetical protein